MNKTIRITQKTADDLNRLQQLLKTTKIAIIEKAINRLYRETFIEEGNKQYEALFQKTQDAQEEIEERELWDATLDDLSDEV